jgi:hypothetical protein
MGVTGSQRGLTVLGSVSDAAHHPNEDCLGSGNNLTWVLDGASSLSDERVTGTASDAAWLVRLVSDFLQTQADCSKPLREVARDAVNAVREAASGWRGVPEFPPSAAIGLVRLRGNELEYFVLGDVTVAIAQQGPSLVVSDHTVDRASADVIRIFRDKLERTGSFCDARAFVNPLLANHRAEHMNRSGGYWIVALDPDAVDYGYAGRVAAENVRRVLICTDGFARLVEPFGHYSWDRLLSLAPSELNDRMGELRRLERQDPQCVAFPRWSVSDDATALMLGLTGHAA